LVSKVASIALIQIFLKASIFRTEPNIDWRIAFFVKYIFLVLDLSKDSSLSEPYLLHSVGDFDVGFEIRAKNRCFYFAVMRNIFLVNDGVARRDL
jgi:hypothetical protein